ncbi:integrin alpha-E [Pelodytes ibericus]
MEFLRHLDLPQISPEKLITLNQPFSGAEVAGAIVNLREDLSPEVEACGSGPDPSGSDGFYAGGSTEANTRRVLNILETIHLHETPSALLALDAEKAFDRVNWHFLFGTLRAFGLSGPFLQFTRALYISPSAKIKGPALTSELFPIHNGTRQGCPLAPLLYALGMEPLAVSVRKNPLIRGIEIGKQDHSITLYADDVLLSLSVPLMSIPALMKEIQQYGHYSNYKINISKTQIIPLYLNEIQLNILDSMGYNENSPERIDYLGITFCPKLDQIIDINYTKLKKQLKTMLSRWKGIEPSWMGRIAILKSYVVPKLLYILRALPMQVPPWHLKDLDLLFASYVWAEGRSRISRRILMRPLEKGGLGYPDLFQLYETAQLAHVLAWNINRTKNPPWLSIEHYKNKQLDPSLLIWVTPMNARNIGYPAAFTALECFNIDTVNTWSFTSDKKSLFGQKVLQYQYGAEKGVYVSSPLKDIENRIFDGLYQCKISKGKSKLQCIMMNMFQGGSQAFGKTRYPIVSLARHSDSTLVCQQMKGRKIKSTAGELNGLCTLMDGISNETYTYIGGHILEGRDNQIRVAVGNVNNNNNVEDEEDGTEIAIVLDGSGSISENDFQKAKDFISNMMKKFWEKCTECEFAVVQYGSEIQTEFDLKESRQASEQTLQKVQLINQLGNVTKTASALQHVLDSIFNEAHGSKPQATKIILVLTDGDIFMDPMNLTTVINSPKMKDIERFVIGIGGAFNRTKALNELKLIASEGEEHLIKVEDYSALDGLLSSLQQKIIGIEGTKGDKLEFDLAEIGFAVHVKDKMSLVFGAVGSFDWSGGLILYQASYNPYKVEFLSEPKDDRKTSNYGYLGYSVTVAQGKHSTLYIAGAPRHSNVGRVLVFEEEVTSYRLTQKNLKGEQLGSYFGFELCTLDITSDGITDFLLVGAPFYHLRGEEGKVYMYKLHKEGIFTLFQTLEQQHYSFARFGYSIVSIGDINQDGYQDIAIGAPLEGHLEQPNSFGTVYIYNCNKHGILPTPSQRIRATDFTPKLQYFGQSIDGGLDLTNDGYLDLAVGARANVMVLRARPVVKVKTDVRFIPDKIPLILSNNKLSAHVCFEISPFNVNEIKKSYLHYSLDLDVDMEEKRVMFDKEDSGKGRLFLIDNTCAHHVLTVLPCNYDCFSNIKIKISYALMSDLQQDLPAPILDMYDQLYKHVEVPYVKDCNNKSSCVPALHLYTHLSGKELTIGLTKDLTMNLTLTNSGDDSYMTTLQITFPANLLVKIIKMPNSPSIKCSDPTLRLVDSSMNCDIGHPVFKASVAPFSIIWELVEVKFPKEKAVIDVNVTSFNNIANPLSKQTVLPVKHSFSAVLSV